MSCRPRVYRLFDTRQRELVVTASVLGLVAADRLAK
jgi:hypothetical protein